MICLLRVRLRVRAEAGIPPDVPSSQEYSTVENQEPRVFWRALGDPRLTGGKRLPSESIDRAPREARDPRDSFGASSTSLEKCHHLVLLESTGEILRSFAVTTQVRRSAHGE